MHNKLFQHLPIYDPSVKVAKGLSPNSSHFSYERPLLARNLRDEFKDGLQQYS